MTAINQTYNIDELSKIKVEVLPTLTFKESLNKLKQNIKYRYLPFKLYHRIRCKKNDINYIQKFFIFKND